MDCLILFIKETFLNKLTEAIPFVLLLALVPFFYYNSPNIAQSIIVLSVSGLCGYRYYLMHKEQPNYSKVFNDEIIRIQKELVKINEGYGKLTINDINKKREENKFYF